LWIGKRFGALPMKLQEHSRFWTCHFFGFPAVCTWSTCEGIPMSNYSFYICKI
jgi:hypothetical protein